jgi:hypothetical protein
MKRKQTIRGSLFACALTLATQSTTFAQVPTAPAPAVQAFTEVSAAILGLNFSDAQRDQLQRYIDGYWQRQDKKNIQSVENTLDFAAKLRELSPEPSAVALRITRPDVLLGLEKERAEGDPVAAFLLDTYYRANPILAPAKAGGLPLTRDTVDGQLELQYFMASEIHRQPVTPLNAEIRERAYRSAAAVHGQLTASQQVAAARAPGEVARLRYGWNRASAQDRLLGRAELGAALTPQEQAEVQQIMASFNAQLNNMAAQHQQSMLGTAIQNMQQNSDIIMGSGTAWNPTTNRWEQKGGIVTEYNGTVRVP